MNIIKTLMKIVVVVLYNLSMYWDIEQQNLHNQITLSNESIYKKW